jgi:hypothetical protein
MPKSIPDPIIPPEPAEGGEPRSLSVGKEARSSSDGVSRQPDVSARLGSRTTEAGGDRPKAARPAGAGREADDDDASGTGLVICAKNVRSQVEQADRIAQGSADDAVVLSYPSSTMVASTASLFRVATPWAEGRALRGEQAESLTCRVHIGPGVVQLSSQNPVRAARSAERKVRHHEGDVADHEWHVKHGSAVPAFEDQRSITEWSRKSRSNMCKTLASLDYSPLVDGGRTPAMVTLTYPGKDWEVVAPSGKAVKRHLTLWRKRLEREYSQPARFVWKLEFQRRGAPHVHLWLAVPSARGRSGHSFRDWVSIVWAQIVDHPDPVERRKHLAAGTRVDVLQGLKACDPKRLAIYFTKHSTPDGMSNKEYQNRVPELWQEQGRGPGRFWGRVGLDIAVNVVEIELEDYINARRVLRRWSRSQAAYASPSGRFPSSVSPRTSYRMVQRTSCKLGDARYRRVRRRRQLVDQGGLRGGYTLANNGAGLGSQLARALDVMRR